MIPDFDENGFLPEGIWDADLAEFAKRFAVFRRSDRRFDLFEELRKTPERSFGNRLDL